MTNNLKNLAMNSPETLQVLPKATHEAHNPTNISKASPKTAKVHKKSSKGGPKAPKRVQKESKKLPKSSPKGIPKRLLNRTPNLRPLFPLNVSKT